MTDTTISGAIHNNSNYNHDNNNCNHDNNNYNHDNNNYNRDNKLVVDIIIELVMSFKHSR